MTDFEALIRRLGSADVRFVLIGGFAGTVLGSPRITVDLDIVYARDADNLARLAAAAEPLSPYLRGAPPGLPFRLDPATLARGLNFTLTTSLGDLDLLGEVVGGGTYERLLPHTRRLRVFDADIDVVTLPQLIRLKRAADGRRISKPLPNSRPCSKSSAAAGSGGRPLETGSGSSIPSS